MATALPADATATSQPTTAPAVQTPPAGSAVSAPTAGPTEKPDAGNSLRASMEALRHASLSTPEAQTAKPASPTDVSDLVRKLQSIRVPDRIEPSQAALASRNDPPAPAQPTSRPAEPQVKLNLDALPAEAVADPIGLGDMLFKAERLDAAAAFYELAIKRQLPGDDRAWALFQLGNCLCGTDPARAKAMYQAVLSEFPGSTWASMADLQQRLLDWYATQKPREFLQSVNKTAAPASQPALAVGRRPNG